MLISYIIASAFASTFFKGASAKCTERRKQMRNQNKHSEKSNVEIRTNIQKNQMRNQNIHSEKSRERRKKLFKKSLDFLNSFFLRSIYSNVLFRNVTI